MVHLLPYYQLDSFSTNHRNIKSKKYLDPQLHLQMINVAAEVQCKLSMYGPRNTISDINE